jgi:transcriptional regulator with XRE-family HTH domain
MITQQTKTEEEIRAAIANKLRDYRAAHKSRSQQMVANKFGIPRPRLASYEEQRATPPLSTLYRMSKVMGMSLYELTELCETC